VSVSLFKATIASVTIPANTPPRKNAALSMPILSFMVCTPRTMRVRDHHKARTFQNPESSFFIPNFFKIFILLN
jgi:hypothetical protein